MVETFQPERDRGGRDQVHVARVDPRRRKCVLEIPRDQEILSRVRLREGSLPQVHECIPLRVQEQAERLPIVLPPLPVPRGRVDEERGARPPRDGPIQGALVLGLPRAHGRVRPGSGEIPSACEHEAAARRASARLDGDDRPGASVLGETVASERVVLGYVSGPPAQSGRRARETGHRRVVQGQRVSVLLECVPR